MTLEQLIADLERDEGVKLEPYTDTVGKLTIGVGHNLTDRGLTREQVKLILHDDINTIQRELDRELPWWRTLTDGRQRGLCNMAFNMGLPRLSTFKRMLAALREGRNREAAEEALDSRWAYQVKTRAERIATLFRED